MKVLDATIDNNATSKGVVSFAELAIRNLLCFRELQHYNDYKRWLFKHPLLEHESELSKLRQLKKSNPAQFLKEYSACDGNIKRYRSYYKSSSRVEKRESDKENLKRWESRKRNFETILKEENENNYST